MSLDTQLRLFLDLVSMVYFHLVPVFNWRTASEERGWLLSPPCVLSFRTSCHGLCSCLPGWPSPREPSQGFLMTSTEVTLLLFFGDTSGPAFSSAPSFCRCNHVLLTHPSQNVWPLHPGSNSSTGFIFILKMFIYLSVPGLSCSTWGSLILVAAFKFLVVACEVSFPDQGSNQSPLHWEHGVLATGPPGKRAP